MPYGRDVPTIAPAPTLAPDYDAPETMIVADPAQFRALADDVRTRIIAILRHQARSTQQLAEEMGIPKGTVGHHLKVLEKAGLIRVVRTPNVRAMSEKFYGRTARLFLFQAEDPADARALGAATLRQAASEMERAPAGAGFGLVRARLTKADVIRFERRIKKLMDDFRAADDEDGNDSSLALGWWGEAVDCDA